METSVFDVEYISLYLSREKLNHETDITIHRRSWTGILFASKSHYPNEKLHR